jgi:GNAT superfamily N-acetyltransferase
MMWMVTPSSRPAYLGPRLEEHGLVLHAAMPGMARDLTTLPPTGAVLPGVSIDEVRDAAMLADWSRVGSRGSGLPDDALDVFAELGHGEGTPIRHFVAYREGEAVATSTLYMGAGVAGIYCVAVVPEARRQGFGAAITLAALVCGRELGCRIATLQASPMGAPVYRRLGFEEHGSFSMYVWQQPPATSASAAPPAL